MTGKKLSALGLTALAMLLLAGHAAGQELVVNGDFETKSITPQWTYFGGNSHTGLTWFQTQLYKTSLCMKRCPGTPNDNGGIEQQVYLVNGVSYDFSADIAAQYCSS